MRSAYVRFFIHAIMILAILSPYVYAAAPNPDSTLIRVNVIVTDSKDRIITGLEKEHFEIYDNKKKQEIAFFSKEDGPVSLGILVDISGSSVKHIPALVQALNGFLGSLHNDDEVFIIKFNNEVFLLKDLTSPGNIVLNDRMFLSMGGTAFYDALYLALGETSRMRHSRRALLVISDGLDRDSHYSFDGVCESIRVRNVQVFAVFSTYPERRSSIFRDYSKEGKETLEELTEASGGRVLFPDNSSKSEFTRALDQIHAMLRLQYSIGFYPADAGSRKKEHKVKIKVHPPEKIGRLTVSYKKSIEY